MDGNLLSSHSPFTVFSRPSIGPVAWHRLGRPLEAEALGSVPSKSLLLRPDQTCSSPTKAWELQLSPNENTLVKHSGSFSHEQARELPTAVIFNLRAAMSSLSFLPSIRVSGHCNVFYVDYSLTVSAHNSARYRLIDSSNHRVFGLLVNSCINDHCWPTARPHKQTMGSPIGSELSRKDLDAFQGRNKRPHNSGANT